MLILLFLCPSFQKALLVDIGCQIKPIPLPCKADQMTRVLASIHLLWFLSEGHASQCVEVFIRFQADIRQWTHRWFDLIRPLLTWHSVNLKFNKFWVHRCVGCFHGLNLDSQLLIHHRYEFFKLIFESGLCLLRCHFEFLLLLFDLLICSGEQLLAFLISSLLIQQTIILIDAVQVILYLIRLLLAVVESELDLLLLLSQVFLLLRLPDRSKGVIETAKAAMALALRLWHLHRQPRVRLLVEGLIHCSGVLGNSPISLMNELLETATSWVLILHLLIAHVHLRCTPLVLRLDKALAR